MISRILLIEREGVRQVFEQLLHRAGHVVSPALDLDEALLALSGFDADVIICIDPGDAERRTGVIAALRTRSRAPVVMTSGRWTAHHRSPVGEPVYIALAKPFSGKELLDAICQALALEHETGSR